MYLSDVFKFTQGLGQKGHQIGRKVGDAIELLTLGMINQDTNLTKHLVIEDGVEGATSAKHKVEFSFYRLTGDGRPSKISGQLFGIIECKKVGVEQTIKTNFKQWKSIAANKKDFHETNGYSFTISRSDADLKFVVKVIGEIQDDKNIKVIITKTQAARIPEIEVNHFKCSNNQQLLIAVNTSNELFLLGPGEKLSQVEGHIVKCVVVEIKKLNQSHISQINVNESLAGPQTPEKAKQASFVSLDVRKRVMGNFDKTNDKSFVSVLVIGEASHWENKSRSMIRLCNDFNLIIPDNVIVYFFQKIEEEFGDDYQDMITKNKYKESEPLRKVVSETINHFEKKVLLDMDSHKFVTFEHQDENGSNRLKVAELSNQ